jgi:hypothetical protein
MICPMCEGEGCRKARTDDGGLLIMPCLTCNGSGFVPQETAAKLAYRDDKFPERACDHCGKPYRGPAVYCSLECAVADA